MWVLQLVQSKSNMERRCNMNAVVKHSKRDLGKEVRWNPLKDFMDVDRFWDEFKGLDKFDSVFCPKIGLKESKGSFTVTMQLPGIAKEDIKVGYDMGVLTVSAVRRAEKVKEGEKYHRNEHEYGCFYNRVALPGRVDGSKIHAEYKNGMLNVELPKSKGKAVTEINVK